jgi:hypothetical protein
MCHMAINKHILLLLLLLLGDVLEVHLRCDMRANNPLDSFYNINGRKRGAILSFRSEHHIQDLV